MILAKLKFYFTLLFYLCLLCFPFVFKAPQLQKAPLNLLGSTFSGSNQGFKEFGQEFNLFKPYLPTNKPMTFIMDYPFNPYGRTISQLYTAQNYFAPLLLNPHPGELGAIVYCSNEQFANKRLAETGYKLVVPLAEGKGIAVKK